MADKRPLVITAAGTVTELKPPDTIPADVLPPAAGASRAFAFFVG